MKDRTFVSDTCTHLGSNLDITYNYSYHCLSVLNLNLLYLIYFFSHIYTVFVLLG